MLAAIIALFTVGGCKSAGKVSGEDPSEEPVCVYGIPMAYYKVHGTVTDQKDKPIAGVEVQVFMTNDGNAPEEEREYEIVYLRNAQMKDNGPAVLTDEQGNYTAEGEREFGSRLIKVTFVDPLQRFASDSVISPEPNQEAPGQWESNYEFEVNAKLKGASKKAGKK